MIDKKIIKNKLTTKILGRNIDIYDIIDSTQTKIKKEENIKEGTVIIAEEQTKGKGTHGRVWFTDSKYKNIAMSFVLFPNCNVSKFKSLTLIIAKCITETFLKLYNIKLDIKVPNDIMANSRKIGGILTETRIQNEEVKRLYIGIGINILQEKFNYNINDIASSIYNEFNIKCSREDIIASILNIFETKYLKILED